jgi:hypothetical protein
MSPRVAASRGVAATGRRCQSGRSGMNANDPHEVYALANRHADHPHFGDDLTAGRDWIPAAVECEGPISVQRKDSLQQSTTERRNSRHEQNL